MNVQSCFPNLGFSVVVTCYNLQEYIKEALISVFNQDAVGIPIEIIVIDDASTDMSYQIIRETVGEFAQGREVTIIKNERNLGVAASINIGFQKAKYDWIIEVDGDDIQLPDRLSGTLQLINKYPGAVMICLSQMCFSYANREKISSIRYAATPEMCGNDDSCCIEIADARFLACAEQSRHRIAAWGCSMAVKKELVNRWGNLNTELSSTRMAQDPAWEFRAYLSGSVVGSMRPGVMYRSHDSNILNRAKLASPRDFQKKQFAMFAATCRHKCADLRRACSEEGLTDFSRSQLEELETILLHHLQYFLIKKDWWQHNVFSRVVILIKNYGMLSAMRRRELLLRCLPFCIFTALKSFRGFLRKR